jgi:hypothetical protein
MDRRVRWFTGPTRPYSTLFTARPKRAAAAALIGILAILLGASHDAWAATESTNWQVDSTHAGFVYGAGVVPPLAQAWSDDLGRWETSSVIDDGHVFAVAGAGQGPYGPAQALDSIDLDTGAISWSQPIDTNRWDTTYVTVDAGKVFTANAYSNYDQSTSYVVMSAFDEGSGTLLWSTRLPGNVWSPTAPVVSNGRIYVDAEGQGGAVYALRESDGAIVWDTGPLLVGNSLVLANGTLVIAGECELSYGLDPATGRILWNDYDNCDGGGTLMSSFDGAQVWGEDSRGGQGSDTGYVYNPGTGAVTKRFTGYAPAFGYGEAVQTTLSADGYSTALQAIDPASLAVRWSFAEPSGTEQAEGSMPLLADGYVFAEGSQGQVWALSPCTGDVVWQSQVSPFPNSISWEPLPGLAAGDGYLVVPTANGLTAFKGHGVPTSPAPNCQSTGDGAAPDPPASTTPTPAPSPTPPPADTTPQPPVTTSVTSAKTPSTPVPAPSRTQQTPSTLKLVRTHCVRARGPHDSTIARCQVAVEASQGVLTARLMQGKHRVASGRVSVVRGRAHLTMTVMRPRGHGAYVLVLSLNEHGRAIARQTQRIRLPGG